MAVDSRPDPAVHTVRQPRFVSQLTRYSFAMVLEGAHSQGLNELTDWCSKPAVSFGGKFRFIDFALSACVNSGVRRVGVARPTSPWCTSICRWSRPVAVAWSRWMRRTAWCRCRNCTLPDGTCIGLDAHEDAQRFHVTPAGVTLVTRVMLGQELGLLDDL
jgi:hypothetical protein